MNPDANPGQFGIDFLGVPATQTWNDLLLWERFFNTYALRGFLELGTGMGGMSLYLALQCAQRGIEFWTVDEQTWLDFGKPVTRMLNLASRYAHAELFNGSGDEFVARCIQSAQPLMLFCDDGNKPGEVRKYGGWLRRGDFIAVHDWGVEIGPADLQALDARYLMQAECERWDSQTRWLEIRNGRTPVAEANVPAQSSVATRTPWQPGRDARMEFTGTRLGAVQFKGPSGAVYRGSANLAERFENVKAEDITFMLQSGEWRVVE